MRIVDGLLMILAMLMLMQLSVAWSAAMYGQFELAWNGVFMLFGQLVLFASLGLEPKRKGDASK